MNNLETLQASRVDYEAARVAYEAARASYEAEIEATLALAVEALAGVDRLVKDLAPYADPSYRLVPSLARACEVYAELKGETE